MFARKVLDPRFIAWNEQWGAPFGRAAPPKKGLKCLLESPDEFDMRGMFGFQVNNDTRAFEYPWAFFQGDISPGVKVLEVGGGMSGFQFALSNSGAKVVNVDPGMDDIGGRVSRDFFSRANAKYSTDVELVERVIAESSLPAGSFDIAYSISVIEHIPQDQLGNSMQAIARLLKPGGRLILTVDLFLDLYPFSKKKQNRFGTNVSMRELLESSGLHLEIGDPQELYGFSEFDAFNTMASLPELWIGTGYPTLVQCAVFARHG